MSASQKTTNYDLPIFADDDTPTWLGDFNDAMTKIDTGLKSANDTANAAESANTANISNLTSRVANVEANLNDKAPTDHSSAATTYGIGNASRYGHVLLTDDLVDSDAALGAAATPKLVKSVSDSLVTTANGLATLTERVTTAEGTIEEHTSGLATVNNSLTTLTSTVAGKAPTSHASTNTTYGIGTASNYGHVKLVDSNSSAAAASGTAASPTGVKAIVNAMSPNKLLWSGNATCGGGTIAVKVIANEIADLILIGVSSSPYTVTTSSQNIVGSTFYTLASKYRPDRLVELVFNAYSDSGITIIFRGIIGTDGTMKLSLNHSGNKPSLEWHGNAFMMYNIQS